MTCRVISLDRCRRWLRRGTPEAAAWVSRPKTLLAQSNLRQVLRHVRLFYPRGSPLPDPVRKAVLYLFDHRWRMRYREFRQAAPRGHRRVCL